MVESEKIKVLFIDDEQHNLLSFKATFRRDFEVDIAISTSEARLLLQNKEFHVILSDQRMPTQTGVEFFEEIIPQYPDIMRILITGYTDIDVVVDAVNKGKIFKYLTKPWDPEALKTTVIEAFSEFQKKVKEKKDINELKEVNEQLEFLARQSIIS